MEEEEEERNKAFPLKWKHTQLNDETYDMPDIINKEDLQDILKLCVDIGDDHNSVIEKFINKINYNKGKQIDNKALIALFKQVMRFYFQYYFSNWRIIKHEKKKFHILDITNYTNTEYDYYSGNTKYIIIMLKDLLDFKAELNNYISSYIGLAFKENYEVSKIKRHYDKFKKVISLNNKDITFTNYDGVGENIEKLSKFLEEFCDCFEGNKLDKLTSFFNDQYNTELNKDLHFNLNNYNRYYVITSNADIIRLSKENNIFDHVIDNNKLLDDIIKQFSNININKFDELYETYKNSFTDLQKISNPNPIHKDRALFAGLYEYIKDKINTSRETNYFNNFNTYTIGNNEKKRKTRQEALEERKKAEEKRKKKAPTTKTRLQLLKKEEEEIRLNINISQIINNIYDLIDKKENIEDIKNIFKNIKNSYFAFDYENNGKTTTYYTFSYPYYTEYNNYKILKCDDETYKKIRDDEKKADGKTRKVRERLINNIYNSIRYYFDNKNYLFKYSFENKFTLDYRDYDIIKKNPAAEENVLNFDKSAVYTLSKNIDSDDIDDSIIYEYLNGQNIDSIDSIDRKDDTYEYDLIKIIKNKILLTELLSLSTKPLPPQRRRRIKPLPPTPRKYTQEDAAKTLKEITQGFNERQNEARSALRKSRETLSVMQQNPPSSSRRLGPPTSPRQSRPPTASLRGRPLTASRGRPLTASRGRPLTASQERDPLSYADPTASSKLRMRPKSPRPRPKSSVSRPKSSVSREGPPKSQIQRPKSARKHQLLPNDGFNSDSSLDTETLSEGDSTTSRLSSPRTRSPPLIGWSNQDNTPRSDNTLRSDKTSPSDNTPRSDKTSPSDKTLVPEPRWATQREKAVGGGTKDAYYIIVPCFKRGVEIYNNNVFEIKINTIYDIIYGVKNSFMQSGEDREFATQKLITFNENIHLEISEDLFKKHQDIKGLILYKPFYLKPSEEIFFDEKNISLGLFSKSKDYDDFTFKNETNEIIKNNEEKIIEHIDKLTDFYNKYAKYELTNDNGEVNDPFEEIKIYVNFYKNIYLHYQMLILLSFSDTNINFSAILEILEEIYYNEYDINFDDNIDMKQKIKELKTYYETLKIRNVEFPSHILYEQFHKNKMHKNKYYITEKKSEKYYDHTLHKLNDYFKKGEYQLIISDENKNSIKVR